MKILLNTANLIKGGALQASISFILEALNNIDDIEWCFAISKEGCKELEQYDINLANYTIEVFDKSPARNRQSRRRLNLMEKEFKPDSVFTFFGPSYVKFDAPHLCGVADGWVTHSSLLAYKTLDFPVEWLKFFFASVYKGYWYRAADAWVVEAECARRGLHNRFKMPVSKIAVIPNNSGQLFHENRSVSTIPKGDAKLKILCLSASYKHKNLDIIPYVASELHKQMPGLKFEFTITLSQEDSILKKLLVAADSLNVRNFINNVGPVFIAAAPQLYRSSHICFIPSLLETFTANYPEAMSMGVPIVTTDLNFAHAICGKAALYYEPGNSNSAASNIMALLEDEQTRQNIVLEGKKILNQLPTPYEKYKQYITLLRNLSMNHSLSN